jgi:hypothetical protein
MEILTVQAMISISRGGNVMPATYELDFSFTNYAGYGFREASNLATPGVPAVVRTVIRPPSAFHCIVLVWSFLALANSTALLPEWLSVCSYKTVGP